jgi:hypothetical protein
MRDEPDQLRGGDIMNSGKICRIRAEKAGSFILAGFMLFCIAMLVITPAIAFVNPDGDPGLPRPSAPQASNQQIMKDYGTGLLKDHPEVQSMSNLEKGKFAFTKYCEALAAAGAPVNANAWNRLQNFAGNSERGRWTCSDHTLNLQSLFEGIGIDSKDTLNIMADSNSWLPTPNSNHGALVLFDDDGKPYVFDAWKLAVQNGGTYSGTFKPADSMWNGMDAGQWSIEMRTYPNSYTRFTCDTGVTWDTYAADAIQRYQVPRKVKTATTTATGISSHPVVTRFSGPTADTISSVTKHDFSSVSFTYSLDVTGGSPPYTFTWMGDGYRVIYEGTKYATVTIPTKDLRFNGEGYAIYLTVKDSAGKYAVAKDPNSGVMSNNFAYFINAGTGVVQKMPDV